MNKAQLPLIAELSLGADTQDSTACAPAKFTGTDNPRHLRVIHMLSIRSRKREEIDHIAGASNGPDLIMELRRRGLRIPCRRVPGIDRDGHLVQIGVYSFNNQDRHKLSAWLSLRDRKMNATVVPAYPTLIGAHDGQ